MLAQLGLLAPCPLTHECIATRNGRPMSETQGVRLRDGASSWLSSSKEHQPGFISLMMKVKTWDRRKLFLKLQLQPSRLTSTRLDRSHICDTSSDVPEWWFEGLLDSLTPEATWWPSSLRDIGQIFRDKATMWLVCTKHYNVTCLMLRTFSTVSLYQSLTSRPDQSYVEYWFKTRQSRLATRTSEYGLLHWAGILQACQQASCGAWINGRRLRGAETARL